MNIIEESVRQAAYNSGNREIVIWGDCKVSDDIRKQLDNIGVHIECVIDNNKDVIDDVFYFSPKILKDKGPEKCYVIIPLKVHEDIKTFLNENGFKKDQDYFYYADCILENTSEIYEDAHNNRIFWAGGKPENVNVFFLGENSQVCFNGKVRKSKCKICIGSDSRVSVGSGSCINSEIDVGNKSYLTIGEHSSIFFRDSCNIGNKSRVTIEENVQFINGRRLITGEKTLINIGNNTIFRNNIDICCYSGSKLKIGENGMFVSNNIIILQGDSNIKIGAEFLASWNVSIIANDCHAIFDVKTNKKLNSGRREIIIGNHVWVGADSTILYNTDIGDGCIVGTRSLVKSSISNNSMAAGIPAKVKQRHVAWSRDGCSVDIKDCGEYAKLTEIE